MRTKGEIREMWKTAYEEHGPAVLAFLHSRLGDPHDAEDLLQETFVRAIQAAEPLRDLGKTRSYLFSIAHNTMVNHVRKKREVLLPAGTGADEQGLEAFLDMNAVNPEDIASYSELKDKLEVVMNDMSDAHRKAFEQGVLMQKPYRDIARSTGWSLSQVKINVYRARKQAIAALSEEWKDE